jgi:hypothetical protein
MGMRAPLAHGRASPTARRAGWVLLAALVLTISCGGPAEEPAGEPTPPPVTVEVELFFVNHRLGDLCTDVFPVTRKVDPADPVRGTLEALLAGPTDAEHDLGYAGPFSAATAGTILEVTVTDGLVQVTFDGLRETIPDAATSSCTADRVLAQLDRTLLALDGVSATRYRLADGPTFYAWLGLPDPDAPPPSDGPDPTEESTEEPRETETDPAADRAEPTEPAPEPSDPSEEPTEPEPEVIDLDAGWTELPGYGWPVTPQCCGAPTTGPTSPDDPLPATGWPADGFYDVEVLRPASDLETLQLRIRRWVVPDELPEHWEGEDEVIVADPDEVIERRVDVDALAVVLIPIHDHESGEVAALRGEPDAFATLLEHGIDPAYRRWVFDPLSGGATVEAIEEDLLARSTDPTFPFGQDYQPELHPEGPIAYRGPLGSSLVADPSWLTAPEEWPPGHSGLYSWSSITLELLGGRPVLHLWAGQIAG